MPRVGSPAHHRMPRWVMPISAVLMTTLAAIAIAAQFHPDAQSKVILMELAVPSTLTGTHAVATRAGLDAGPFADDDAPAQEFWREEKIVRGDTVMALLS